MNRETDGIILALLASISFESGYLLMTQESRHVGRAGRPGGRLLMSLVARPLWLLAMALDGAGIVLELFALREASLIVVQPLMSVGLIGLVLAARVILHERVGPATILGVVAVAAGVALVIVAAPSDARHIRLGHPVASIAVLAALGAIVTSAYLTQSASRPWRLVVAAAAGDTLVAISGNEIARTWIERPLLAIAWVAAVAASGIGSVTAESAALQRLPASRVGPIVSATGAILPALLLALLSPHRVHFGTGHGVELAVGLVLTGAGAFQLSATARDALPDAG